MSTWFETQRKRFLLSQPSHDERHLPALREKGMLKPLFRSVGKIKQKKFDMQIVQEFRSKLRRTEDLIAKLAFNLREIQGVRRKPKPPR